jgi:hypothetical protein
MIDISGLDKALVLAALYNNSMVQGLGRLNAQPDVKTPVEAQAFYNRNKSWDGYYDYVCGRVMKVDLNGDSFSPALYDRDVGEGMAEQVITRLRQTGEISKI